MEDKKHTLEELYAILTEGGRLRGERSHARPYREYGDPANHIKFPAEIERDKKLKNAKRAKKRRKK